MALLRANHDDTINIAAGVYAENNLEVGKRVTLQASGSANTIIDGHSAARIMRMDYNATLADLTLCNGRIVTITGNLFNDGGGAIGWQRDHRHAAQHYAGHQQRQRTGRRNSERGQACT